MRVHAPADKRFRRARVAPTRRSRWPAVSWGTARLAVVLALVLFGVYRGARVLLSAPALTITTFDVSGNGRVSTGEVIAILEGLRGSNMATVDLEPWRQRLLRSPWVAEAVMRRVLPGTVAIAISERRPLGIARIGDELSLVDDRGEIIDEFGPNYADLDLPIINGLAVTSPGADSRIDREKAVLAVRVLADLQPHPTLASMVSEIDVTDARDAVVLLKEETALLRLGDERFAERLQSYLDIAPALRERVALIDYVDMRFDERVYVRPQGKGRVQPVSRKVRQEE